MNREQEALRADLYALEQNTDFCQYWLVVSCCSIPSPSPGPPDKGEGELVSEGSSEDGLLRPLST
jgi:hypothetical protein